jgi:hypothetical protein
MSVISSAMRLLDEVGLIQADLDKAVGESAEIKGAVRDKAIEVKRLLAKHRAREQRPRPRRSGSGFSRRPRSETQQWRVLGGQHLTRSQTGTKFVSKKRFISSNMLPRGVSLRGTPRRELVAPSPQECYWRR